MIRQFEFKDIPKAAVAVKKQLLYCGISDDANVPLSYYRSLLGRCLDSDNSIVSVDDEGNFTGAIFGIVSPNILQPSSITLDTIMTWVVDDLKGTTTFHRMLRAFNSLATDKINSGAVTRVVTHKVHGLTPIDYSRIGYRAVQTSFEREN